MVCLYYLTFLKHGCASLMNFDHDTTRHLYLIRDILPYDIIFYFLFGKVTL